MRGARHLAHRHAVLDFHIALLIGRDIGQTHAVHRRRRHRRLLPATTGTRIARILSQFSHHHLHIARRLVAPHLRGHPRAGLASADDAWQIFGRADGFAIETQDHVTRLDARLIRRAAFFHRIHQRAGGLGQAEAIRQFLGHRLYHHGNAPARHPARRTQLPRNIIGDINRYGKRQSHESARTAVDLRVDTHYFATQIKQRPTRVTGVDCHVSLYKRHKVFLRQRTALGAYDARCHCVIKTKGRTDGHHPLAHFQPRRVAEFNEGQAGRFNFYQRHVGAPVSAYGFRLELAFVGETHGDFIRRLHHMRIGQDVTVGADNEAGSQ